jgi:hypothetical protein
MMAELCSAAVTATEAAQTVAAQEKMVLEGKVAELEQNLVLAGVDLKIANKQAADLAAKLQDGTDEGAWLCDTIIVRDQDI